MKRIGLAVFLLLPLLAHGDDAVRVATILGGIDTPRGEPIPFIEKRQSQLLEEPLVLYGNVLFTQEGTLSKRIERPFQERVTISANSMELERKGRVRRVSLDKRAGVKVFYAGMRALLERDTDALIELFDVSTFADEEANWRIELVPKEAGLRTFVEQLIISGRGSHVLTVHTDQPGGDWQEMSFDRSGD
ncbi:MAG: hypothetical protein OER85_04230 [Gammaproteobacteria bacterium]|nr:hypothetical protein [Gammaproteobacteria bacterium]